MLQLTPYQVFQATQKDAAAAHQSIVRTAGFSMILSFALAEMAGRANVTSENLVGARMAFNILLNLAEKPDVAKPPLPNKDLGQPIKKKTEPK